MAKGNFFKTIRISILLIILASVALGGWLSKVRTTDWREPLWVTIYPINGDNSPVTAKYISELIPDQFLPIEAFVLREAKKFDLSITEPVIMKLRSEVKEQPPKAPGAGNVLKIMWWSLKLRLWANKMEDRDSELPGDIRMFVVYYDPQVNPTVQHSLGLQKGLLGVVHAFAGRDQNAQNNVVITHEMLHTLGATDKYDVQGNLPIYPAGFAEPNKQPLYPQKYAEIMGGRIPKSENEATIPLGLKRVVVGSATAVEINWVK